MTLYEVVDALPSHIDPIASRIRQADLEECWAGGALTIRDALAMSLSTASLARTWLVDGVPGAMGGIGSWVPGIGRIWLLTTDLVEGHQKEFLRASFKEFRAARADYEYLSNFVMASNDRAIQWLRHLGFVFGDAQFHGPMCKMFYHFYWQKENL